MTRELLLAFAAGAGIFAGVGPVLAGSVSIAGLSGPVDVYFDAHAVPHIYAHNWPDAARVLGYLHARDRLWQMDLLRRKASGRLAEVLGPGALEADVLMRQLGIRAGCETLWKSDKLPAPFREELRAYADGVNAYIAEIGTKRLPLFFQQMGYQPEAWSPVDSLSFSKYMGWDQSGTTDDLWFGAMVERLGVAAAEALWPLERPYEIPTVKLQSFRRSPSAGLVPRPGEAKIYLAILDRLNRAGWLGRGLSFGSNNWAVDGTKTASGKPILCSDPHLGFSLPSIWYTCHLSVAGENIAGVSFPVGPGIVIGHNDRIAWGITNMQADAVDFYVEQVDPQNPGRYRHRAEWKSVGRRVEQIKIRGKEPRELVIDSTVHGPIIERKERTVSLAWTGLGPTNDPAALWSISHAHNLQEFLSACDQLVVPCLNLAYADVDGNIALHPCGSLPLRLPGQGRIPMDGASGENDWAGMIPRRALPLTVNPPEHYVASANGRPSPLGYPYYLGWMWDVSYRTRRINELLARGTKLTADSMTRIQTDVHDVAAEQFLPAFLNAVRSQKPGGEPARRALEEIAAWNFEATIHSAAPVLWLKWLEKYRKGVWDDEWSSRSIKQPEGSWGFSDINGREPMLEVLEYMTRSYPTSSWFDDRSTEERETRDDIIRRAFTAAVAEVTREFGSDPAAWRWGKINRLKIGSLAGEKSLGREGTPVPGTPYTVNPGSDGGTVGGGASWRMIVDLADPQNGLGVYPGGQSGDPRSPHYDDQIATWADGKYLSLQAVSDPGNLDAETQKRKETFVGR